MRTTLTWHRGRLIWLAGLALAVGLAPATAGDENLPADLPPAAEAPAAGPAVPEVPEADADTAPSEDVAAEPGPDAEAQPDAPEQGDLETSLPDVERLRDLIQRNPTLLGPLSIGSPDAGLLVNPVAMPEGELWQVRNPREAFATAETIDFIVAAIETVEERHPGSPRLLIGDLSRGDGGQLNRHASHQAGRDADIGFYYRPGEASAFRRPRRDELDVGRTWALVRAFITETDVERIFLDRAIQRPIYAHALAAGEDRGWLDDIFGRRTGGKDALIQHVRRHYDHMHVRFYNTRAQEWGRLAYRPLFEAGLVPGPTVKHRVRRGETLSHLARRYGTSVASIRRANGIRSSLLRAGRSYVIPVRRMPPEHEPTLVPPRRVPPERDAPVAEGTAPVGEQE